MPVLEFSHMNRKLVSFLGVLSLILGLWGCAGGDTNAPSVETPPGSTAAALLEFPLGCQPDAVLLRNLRAQLPYQQAEIVYQAYGGEHVLVVWIVEPELGGGLDEENLRMAAVKAAAAARILDGASVCIQKFHLLHLTIVDSGYFQWFSGAVRPTDIDESVEEASGGGPQGERGAGMAAVTAAPGTPPGDDDCDWPAAREALDEIFTELDIEAAAYFVRDSSGSNIFLHWVTPEGVTAEDSLELLPQMAAALTCLFPRPAGLSLTVSGPDGGVQLTGYLPGRSSRRGTAFDLDDLDFQVLQNP